MAAKCAIHLLLLATVSTYAFSIIIPYSYQYANLCLTAAAKVVPRSTKPLTCRMTKSSPSCLVLGLFLNADPFFFFSGGRDRDTTYYAELFPAEHFVLYGGNLMQNQPNAECQKQGREVGHYRELLEEAGRQSTGWGTVSYPT